MKIYDIDVNVDDNDFETFFQIYTDRKGNYSYNLNSTIYLSFSDETVKNYMTKMDMFWTTISYNIYGTTRLAWLLMKLNGVGPKNMFDIVKAATAVKYIDGEELTLVMNGVRS